MKKYHLIIIAMTLSCFLVSCAHYPPDRYNTQKGAVVGGGMGALIGQAIGGNTESTLIGLAAGTILGALVGKKVVLKSEVDSSVIGGIVARVGGKLLDGSTRSKLAALRRDLVGTGRKR